MFAEKYHYPGKFTIIPHRDNFKRGVGEVFTVMLNDGLAFDVGIWDYDRLYSIPNLYNAIYCDIVKEITPFDLSSYLSHFFKNSKAEKAFRVFDLAAGSGLVGKQLRRVLSIEYLVGCDISINAKKTTEADCPGVYDEYHCLDLSLHPISETFLNDQSFDIYLIVSASGGGDDDSYKDVMTDIYEKLLKHARVGDYFVFNTRESLTSGQREICKLLKTFCSLEDETVRFYRFLIDGSPVNTRYFIYRKW